MVQKRTLRLREGTVLPKELVGRRDGSLKRPDPCRWGGML